MLHFGQNIGRNLLRRVCLALNLHGGVTIGGGDDLIRGEAGLLLHHRILEPAADKALGGEEGIGGVGHRLALGGLADEALTILGEGDHGGGGAGTFGVLDHLGFAIHNGDAGIGGAEIDTDDFAHPGVLLVCGGLDAAPEGTAPGPSRMGFGFVTPLRYSAGGGWARGFVPRKRKSAD